MQALSFTFILVPLFYFPLFSELMHSIGAAMDSYAQNVQKNQENYFQNVQGP